MCFSSGMFAKLASSFPKSLLPQTCVKHAMVDWHIDTRRSGTMPVRSGVLAKDANLRGRLRIC